MSVGMPVYNGGRFLRQALDALLAQDHEPLELIISDNASTDETPRVCEAFATRDRRIRYYRTPRNDGAIANFNRVLAFSGGEYFMWAAADDLWEPTCVSTLLGLLEASPRAVLAFCAFDNIDERGMSVRTYPHLLELPAAGAYRRLRNYLMQDEALGKANLIYGLTRRSALQATGGLRPWGRGLVGADMLAVFRLMASGGLELTRELLFHKRLLAPHPAEENGRQVRSTIAARAIALYGWLGYFSGCARIIGASPGLTASERAGLIAALLLRIGRFCWKGLRRSFIGTGVVHR